MSPALVVLLAAGPIVILVVLFLGIGWLLAAIGGWRALAARYRATAPPQGRRFRAIYGRVGLVNYNSALTVYVSPAGIYLSALALFRPSHPDLFIPASEIAARRERKLLLMTACEMTIGRPAVATVMLPKRVFDDSRD